MLTSRSIAGTECKQRRIAVLGTEVGAHCNAHPGELEGPQIAVAFSSGCLAIEIIHPRSRFVDLKLRS